MIAILHTLGMFAVNLFKSQSRLEAENLLLRHQLSIAMRQAPPRLRLRGSDRALLVWMTRLWPNLLYAVQVVQPETVLRWHRLAFERSGAGSHETGQAAEDRSWPTRSNPADEQGKPTLGRIPDPWRVADAWL